MNATHTHLVGTRGAVAASHPLAVATGIDLLRRGGSAADASIGAMAVTGVVLPQACGLGGDTLILLREAGGGAVSVNGSGAAPGTVEKPVPEVGPGSATVPGCVDGWVELHRRFGRLDLREALSDAVFLAREGFPVGSPLARGLRDVGPRLEGAGGLSLVGAEAGRVVRQPHLADALERVGEHGRDGFYAGEAAARLAADVSALGGHLAAEELANHTTQVDAPIRLTYGAHRLTVQPPVSQGVLALAVLHHLEQSHFRGEGEAAVAAARAFAAAFSHKHELVDRAAAERLIAAAAAPEFASGGEGKPRGGTHTAAVAVADGDGTVVSQLDSIFSPWGARVAIPSGGYLLNNRLSDAATDPASPNAARPGRRPVHTLSPFVLEAGERVVALATPGADGQVQSLVQVVRGLLDDGLSLEAALTRPRWRLVGDSVAVEDGADPALGERFAAAGFEVDGQPFGHPLFGAMVAAGVDRAAGTVFAAVDGRRETWAGVL